MVTTKQYAHTCPKCGAIRQDKQLGLEPLHDCLAWARSEPPVADCCFICNVRLYAAEFWRVLRDDGTCWLNYGDSYASSSSTGHGGWDGNNKNPDGTPRQNRQAGDKWSSTSTAVGNLKPKDLTGIPWRVALALQAGWLVDGCQYSEVDRAWMAGLFDGDGCIGIRKFKSYRKEKKQVYQPGFVVYSVLTNNDIELIDRCIDITGYGAAKIKQRAGSTDNRGINSKRDSYGWRLDGNKAVDVITAIYPYLIAKKKQALIAYNLDVLNKEGREARGNKKVPKEMQEKRAYLKQLINQCNQRQEVDLPGWLVEPTPKQRVYQWYLRSDIIWAKPNPMPESVTDRPTKAHEYIFLFAKRSRYYYDADAVREPHKEPERSGTKENRMMAKGGDGLSFSGMNYTHRVYNPAGRNRRTVWNIATQPYSGAHFATWPEALVEPMIRAGTSERGVCPDCGAPWERVVERNLINSGKSAKRGQIRDINDNRHEWGQVHGSYQVTTTGWRPTCAHDAPPVPATILDPFAGSGTTGVVARRLGRHFVGVDISHDYLSNQARQRLALDALDAWHNGDGIKADGPAVDFGLFANGGQS